ncbi:MAG: DMT family transporter [Gammaproteobacteria bacterium]|nr:DMT family transporter [Gammaproteobacteria bacterium]
MRILGNPTLRLFIGAALISLSPVWVKLVSISPTSSGFYRVLIGGAALAGYLVFSRQRLQLSKRTWQILVLAAVFFTLDLWFWHRSINYVGPGLSTLLANFQVFIMTAAGVLVLRQAPRPMQLLAIPLAFFGLALIVGLDWGSLPADYRLGVVFGLLTAASYAGYLLSLRRSRQDSPHRLPTREVAVISLLTAVFLGITAIAEGETLAITQADDAVWLLCYGIFSHCIGWMFIASSLPHVTTIEAGIALLLQPALSFVWDVLFFARPMTLTELTGAAIALLAIFLGSRPASKQAQGAR